MVAEPWEDLVAHWHRHGTVLNPGATNEQLDQVEGRLGATLPTDFRAFYRRANGMVGDTSDEVMFSLWSLEVIVAAAAEGRGEVEDDGTYMAIGDFLLDSQYYVLRLDGPDAGAVYLVGSGARNDQLAESFAGFLQRLWTDPEGLYMFPRDRAHGV